MTLASQSDSYDILLVDDSVPDAKIFQAALSECSARVRVYWLSSGEEALDFLNQRGRFENIGTVKIVVLDINMPGIDGLETLRQIKITPAISRLPVILLSSSRTADEVDLAYSLGANVYFSKPLSLENYIQKTRVLVQHWLDLAELPTPATVRPERRSSAHAGLVKDQQA